MTTILEQILIRKKEEVKRLKEKNEKFVVQEIQRKSLIKHLLESNEISCISEFKRASPSKGNINDLIHPVEQAELYESSGAAAISVLTDQEFFKGSFQDLVDVKKTVQIPVLCKDFIIDPIQIDYAASKGADLILLIVAALKEKYLLELYQYARSLNLEVLVEVHNALELDSALKLGARLIGVNNRDLKTFKVSIETTENLGPIVKNAGAFLISESGINTKEDVERVRDAGANGILVGEALMKSGNVRGQLKNFKIPSKREPLK